MENQKSVEIRKIKKVWRKPTFRAQVRALAVGDSMVIPTDYRDRMSAYTNAKQASPEARFSIQKQQDGSFRLIKIALKNEELCETSPK